MIEVDKHDLIDLPDIVELIARRPERFVIFCDDLSFDAAEPGYKALKSVLDGSLAAVPDNVLIYATSNRRHLMPEYLQENLETRHVGGEIHPGEAVEEKISLSERFGLWLSFYPFDQDAVPRYRQSLAARVRCGAQRDRQGARRGAAMGAAARLAQRARSLAVRPRLLGSPRRAERGMKERVEVAAAILTRPDGSVLLGQRPPSTFYGGYWEFPGGKIEPGESPRRALARELAEELGIRVTRAYPWLVRDHTYPHAQVRLHFFRVVAWEGAIRDIEHTALAWEQPGAFNVGPMLPANGPLLRALALPSFYALTQAAELGLARQLQRLQAALDKGLRLLQVREPALDAPARTAFAAEATALAQRHGARVLINGDAELAQRIGADGVHLRAHQLSAARVRPGLPLVAASCHSSAELAHAAKLELDFVLLGPVMATSSHPGVEPLGWDRFAQLITACPLPVFAIGGLGARDLEAAWGCGATRHRRHPLGVGVVGAVSWPRIGLSQRRA